MIENSEAHEASWSLWLCHCSQCLSVCFLHCNAVVTFFLHWSNLDKTLLCVLWLYVLWMFNKWFTLKCPLTTVAQSCTQTQHQCGSSWCFKCTQSESPDSHYTVMFSLPLSVSRLFLYVMPGNVYPIRVNTFRFSESPKIRLSRTVAIRNNCCYWPHSVKRLKWNLNCVFIWVIPLITLLMWFFSVKPETAIPPKKVKKEGSGVIIAVLIVCILLLAILGSVLYFLYKKGKICGRSGKQDLTKGKSNKDNIVVEMKSDNTEEAVLLGVNGEKQPPNDQWKASQVWRTRSSSSPPPLLLSGSDDHNASCFYQSSLYCISVTSTKALAVHCSSFDFWFSQRLPTVPSQLVSV